MTQLDTDSKRITFSHHLLPLLAHSLKDVQMGTWQWQRGASPDQDVYVLRVHQSETLLTFTRSGQDPDLWEVHLPDHLSDYPEWWVTLQRYTDILKMNAAMWRPEFHTYLKLHWQLCVLCAHEQGDEDSADQVRDQMDELWWNHNHGEIIWRGRCESAMELLWPPYNPN